MKFNFNKNFKTQLQMDRENLRKMGYIQELDRSIGIFSNFSLSFSVISILTGLITLYGYSQEGTGMFLFWTWPFVGVFQLIMAICLGEIASCYPVAGGVYKWTNILGNSHLGWFNGWISLLGWVACTTGINYGLSEFVLAYLGYTAYGDTALIIIFLMIITLQTLISILGIKLVTKINDISVGLHIFGVIAISMLIIIFAGNNINLGIFSLEKFTLDFQTTNFIPALLMSAWTLTAFDASANISEECINPSRTVPYGMLLSVLVSIIFGSLLLFSLGQATLVTPNLHGNSIVLYVIGNVLGPTLSRFFGLILIMAMLACGLASQTVTIRIVYAFSRDNGFPYSNLWKIIHRKYGTPVFSALLCAALETVLILLLGLISLLLGLFHLQSQADLGRGLPTITSLSTVGIYFSYTIVTGCALLKRDKIKSERVEFQTGKFGYAVNIVSFLWAITISVVILFYCNLTTTIFFMIFVVSLALCYLFYMRKVLEYEYRQLSESELLQIENMRGL
jgi:amino acid transporter